MRRSLTFLMVALLAVASCGVTGEYSDIYQDGIYSHATGAYKIKKIDTLAESARLAGDLSMEMLGDSPYLYDSPYYNPYFYGRLHWRVYPWMSPDFYWGFGFGHFFMDPFDWAWYWPYRHYDPWFHHPWFYDPWYGPYWHGSYWHGSHWRGPGFVGPVYPRDDGRYIYTRRGIGSAAGAVSHSGAGSTAGRSSGIGTNYRPGSMSRSAASGTRSTGTQPSGGTTQQSITRYQRSGSGGTTPSSRQPSYSGGSNSSPSVSRSSGSSFPGVSRSGGSFQGASRSGNASSGVSRGGRR